MHADPSGELANDPAESELKKALIHAVESLTPREKIFIKLVFYRNLPVQDVAAMLHMTVGAVYTQKSRILAKLRTALKGESNA